MLFQSKFAIQLQARQNKLKIVTAFSVDILGVKTDFSFCKFK